MAVSPVVAWVLVLVASMVTASIWLISAPIVTALYGGTGGLIPEEAQGAANILRLEFVVLPIILTVGLTIWAFLVTTRRQAVTTGGYYR